jgi:hypothetical protein
MASGKPVDVTTSLTSTPGWTERSRIPRSPVPGSVPKSSTAGGSPPAAAASPRFHARVIELNLIAPLLVAQGANEVMQGQPEGG